MKLRCWLEGLDGSRLRVGPGGFLLGRGVECAFRTLDTRVSARHAEVNLRDQGVFLTPRGVIPTVLNGRPIHNPRQLSDGDWISLAPGVLYRVVIAQSKAVSWVVSDGEQQWELSHGSRPLHPSENGDLTVIEDGRLLLTFRGKIEINEHLLEPDRRAWALDKGDVIGFSDGVSITVTEGPTPDKPPTPWSPWEPLRYHPPLAAERTIDGRLRLHYPDQLVEVTVREGELLAELLAADDAIDVDPDALLRLQEDLICGGIDGFCLLHRTGDGVRLLLQPDGATREPVSAPPVVRTTAWWLSLSDGSRLWLNSGGVLLGRNPDCDIRYDQPYIHRFHALIRQRPNSAEIVPLGRNPSYIDGVPVSRTAEIREGCWLAVDPGERIRLGRTIRDSIGTVWCTVRLDDGEHTLQTPICSVGGSSRDDLFQEGWPGGALNLYLLNEAVFFETTVPTMHDGTAISPHRTHRLQLGQSITLNGCTLTLLDQRQTPPLTPRMVVLQPFQNAGRLLFRFDNRSLIRVCLPQHRYHLMQLLLESYVGSRLRSVTRTQSPVSLTDIALPRGATRTRDLQMELSGTRRISLAAVKNLFHQVRTDLIRAGINGERMLEIGEGWTRLHLGESCNVTLYS